ncbi:crossover junction endonuclease EME1B-like isoform X1 [Carex littledalei]|uniref:Crossover junction endonuclease EME1B-like isoform X1 n=1 Tax=Carex littledalei TaxID=544730 RepID=A0A833QZB4_9POAL|nr:crossover junction endonuclease EME1B-like isoform X1 [Carex littledalei]
MSCQAVAVDILSDSDGDSSPPPKPPSAPSPILLLDDDDPTPIKPRPTKTTSSSLVALSPLGSSPDVTILPSSFARPKPRASSGKVAGISGMILVESDDESDRVSCWGIDKEPVASSPEIESLSDLDKNCDSQLSGQSNAKYESASRSISLSQSDDSHGITDLSMVGDRSRYDDPLDDNLTTEISQDTNEEKSLTQEGNTRKRKCASDRNDSKAQDAARKKQLKEEKAQLVEERKRKRQEEKLEKEAKKAEARAMKKLEKEKKKWEKGKLALKSIVTEIDPKVIQDGKLGGHLLTRFAEKGFSYRITKNPIEGSIFWKMDVPDEVAQHSSVGAEVPYVVMVYQAKDFCDLVRNNLLMDHVHKLRSQYPSFTICYATNNLMSYLKKCEQSQYKNPSTSNGWRSPPVNEAISKLATHYSQVHSRQCIDEAELADHIVGLTSSLANCQFRKKLTWLSVNANGSIVPNNAVEKNLIKKNTWLKALIAIPKVQPRHAIAIWKKYPTMRSLLNVYMDPHRSVHEKEFLLKDLVMEGILGNGERRLGEVCSKRVYRILMAQSGGIRTDDVEDGADFFG